jgi:hypothetical protein
MSEENAANLTSTVEATSSPAAEVGFATDDQKIRLDEHRISVMNSDRTVLDLPIRQLRRVQFDIERGRPATLVIVPEHPANEPQVVIVPPDQYVAAGRTLAHLGQRLAEVSGADG